jgi:predicted aldo/keto reductase-like oxidoreductase
MSGMSDLVQVENNIKLAENGFPHFLTEDEKS